jgi:2'-5' RNA ligase
MNATSYHLWLKPSGEAYDLLDGTIRHLARELGTSAFEPHVTLLASLDGSEEQHLRRTEDLARELRPTRFVLTEPRYLDEHFRCLFMLVEPSAEVIRYHAVAARRFGKPAADFMPHLSLVYGSFPESRKQEIIAALPPAIRTSFTVASVILLRAESAEPRDWHEIARFTLGASR